jgi:flagellar protein FliS
MATYAASSPKAYRDNAILTAAPERLVVMLYDGARRFLHQAALATSSGEIELAHNKLRRAEDIILHLRDTLDLEQGELAARLHAIYTFCTRHLSQARIERDPQKIEQVSQLLGDLRSAWALIVHE